MIRRLGPDEAGVLKELRLSALADSPHAFRTTYEQVVDRSDADWARLLGPDGNPTFVWEDPTGTQGMVVAAPVDDDPGSVRLVAMWVRPGARGTDVAGRLVERVLAWGREQSARRVVLEVAGGNERAERLYARHGFTRTRRMRADDDPCEIEMEVLL